MTTPRRKFAHAPVPTTAGLQEATKQLDVAAVCRAFEHPSEVFGGRVRVGAMQLGGEIGEGVQVARLDQVLELIVALDVLR